VSEKSDPSMDCVGKCCRGCAHAETCIQSYSAHTSRHNLKCASSTACSLSCSCFLQLQLAALQVARLVLDAGADIDAVDQHLMAPLHYSCANGHLDIVEFAVSAGADMNIADQDGKTPLHTACNWGELRIIQLLVNRGASTEAVDKAGRRPLQCLDPDTFTELKELANEVSTSSGHSASSSSMTAVAATPTASSLVPASEIQAFGLIEKTLARQQLEVEALRVKTAHDQSRLEQTQQRQGWVLDQEVAERERQGQQIVGVAQQLNRFETILKKTAFLHKEVAEQQNRAILQLQAATQHKAGRLLDAQAELEKNVDTERGHNEANRERINKLWDDR
jgi:archaellum component FlaC